MRQPLRKDRHWFLWPSAIACLGFLAGAWANLRLRRPASISEAPLETIELGLHVLLMLSAAVLFGWLTVGIARGPSQRPPKSVGSGEWGAVFGLALAGLFFVAVALRMGIELHAGRAEHPIVLGVCFLVTVVGGAVLTLCVPPTIWHLLRTGTSRVILPDGPVVAGGSFEGAFEIGAGARAGGRALRGAHVERWRGRRRDHARADAVVRDDARLRLVCGRGETQSGTAALRAAKRRPLRPGFGSRLLLEAPGPLDV